MQRNELLILLKILTRLLIKQGWETSKNNIQPQVPGMIHIISAVVQVGRPSLHHNHRGSGL